jgi:predicted O-methyltransferase YrrM
MDFKHITSVLEEIEEFNKDYEEALAIEAAQGRFMHALILAAKPARVLELGTSTGYSAIWLASAAASYGGLVETLERDPEKIEIATRNFKKAGLSESIILQDADINEYIDSVAPGIGFVFMDSEKEEYIDQFKAFFPKLISGAIVSADNVVDMPQETQAYVDYVNNLEDAVSETVPIGNGMEITVKR